MDYTGGMIANGDKWYSSTKLSADSHKPEGRRDEEKQVISRFLIPQCLLTNKIYLAQMCVLTNLQSQPNKQYI